MHPARRARGVLPLLTLLLASCATGIPAPEQTLQPPPAGAWRREDLAPGVELLEFQGPRTRITGSASYLTGSGGSLGFGITVPAGRSDLPRISAAALIVDLRQAELLPVAELAPPGAAAAGSAPAPGPAALEAGGRDKPRGGDARGEVLAIRPSLLLEERGELLAGINATFFEPNVMSVGRRVDPLGLVILEGRLVSEANPGYAALYWLADGTLRIAGQSGPGAPSSGGGESPAEGAGAYREAGVTDALGGYFVVLSAGVATGPVRLRAARSALGLSADRRTAILLAVAGEAPGSSVGLTAREVGAWLASLGAEEGLLLDGGGSSSLAVREAASGAVRMTIEPSWGPARGVERPVATVLAVRGR
ncbi:MAG: phosphodiester glycosidase family protein [Alkalispirochaetaceae bacterium]